MDSTRSERNASMKMIIAIIRPERLVAVQSALKKRDMHLMTVSEVLDCGDEAGSTKIYRGGEFRRPGTKLRLKIAVDEPFVDLAIEAIKNCGGPGRSGDDKVYVMGLDDRGHGGFSLKGAGVAVGI